MSSTNDLNDTYTFEVECAAIDAGLVAVTVNPYFGYLLVQPWASDADWLKAFALLESLDLDLPAEHTLQDDGVHRYDFEPVPLAP